MSTESLGIRRGFCVFGVAIVAVLSNTDRAAVWADLMRDRAAAIAGLTKAQLRAAVDAADQWADDNAAEYNTALPAAARTALTTKQKAALLMYVISRRHNVAV